MHQPELASVVRSTERIKIRTTFSNAKNVKSTKNWRHVLLKYVKNRQRAESKGMQKKGVGQKANFKESMGLRNRDAIPE
jgi:hypothetical protein